MGGPSGIPQKSTTTTKDILIDFLAGGTGLFFSYSLLSNLYFVFYFSCMYIVIIFIIMLIIIICRELFQKQPLHHLNV
jgi:hypothetical protein